MQLDEQIRDALASEARAIPAEAIERLRQIDYRPATCDLADARGRPDRHRGRRSRHARRARRRHSGGVRGLERHAERPVRPPAERGRGDVRRAALGSVEERGERQHGTCAGRHTRAVHARPLPPRTVLFGPRLHLDHGPQSHRRRVGQHGLPGGQPLHDRRGRGRAERKHRHADARRRQQRAGHSRQLEFRSVVAEHEPTHIGGDHPSGWYATEPLSFPPAPPTPAAKPASPSE